MHLTDGVILFENFVVSPDVCKHMRALGEHCVLQIQQEQPRRKTQNKNSNVHVVYTSETFWSTSDFWNTNEMIIMEWIHDKCFDCLQILVTLKRCVHDKVTYVYHHGYNVFELQWYRKYNCAKKHLAYTPH